MHKSSQTLSNERKNLFLKKNQRAQIESGRRRHRFFFNPPANFFFLVLDFLVDIR